MYTNTKKKRPFYKILYLLNSKVVSKNIKQNVSRTSGTHKFATVSIFLHSHKVYRTYCENSFFHPQQHFIHQNMKRLALNEGQNRRKTKKQHLLKTTTACQMNEKAVQCLRFMELSPLELNS